MKKKYLLVLMVSLGAAILISCSNDGTKEKKQEAVSELQTKAEVAIEAVDFSLEQLVGNWKYSEVRAMPAEAGTPPIGEILLAFTSDNKFTFATEGMDELERNLKEIPSLFEIKEKAIYPSNPTSEVDFKINFNNKKVKVYLINENELVLGKGKQQGDDEKPMLYMYFTRVK